MKRRNGGWDAVLNVLRTEPDAVPKWLYWILSASIFVVALSSYHYVATQRTQENEMEKLTPTFSKMWDGFKRTALEPDPRSKEYRLWVDLTASSKRFAIGMGLSALGGAFLGLTMGCFPLVEAFLLRFLTFLHKVPALALLPLLFITFGTGELAKVVLILVGILPAVALDAYGRVKDIPREQFFKAQSLGCSEYEVCFRIVWPQILPKVLDTIRLNLGPALLLLIAAEGIAAEAGMGYRIFVVRRYVAVDIIIPYVMVMTGIMFALDVALDRIVKRFHWVGK